MSPKISVIIPVYNREHVLADTIASVRHQTLEDWELLLIDDGSVDRSFEICQAAASSDARIRTMRTVNQGQCVARNIGLALSRAEYVKFLDSDDLLGTRALEVQWGALQRYDASIARFEIVLFQEGELEQKRERMEGIFEEVGEVEHEIEQSVIGLCNRTHTTFNEITIKRALVEKAGGFRAGQTAGEEGALLKAIAIHAGDSQRIVTSKLPFLLKRLDPGSLAVQVRYDGRGAAAVLRANIRLLELLHKHGEPIPGFRADLIDQLYVTATHAYRNGRWAEVHTALDAWKAQGAPAIPRIAPAYHYRCHAIFGFWPAERLLAWARKIFGRKRQQRLGVSRLGEAD